eukprot:TRINITY_DN2615_c0_g1_i8.p1 TRINITY_DN2615_c0_g1~~TRINITY_DN2615_c0_g1_i8.p1  ORF type:complete len:663 (-),score=90.26 TRINITY_DN2615_c0_g1_i8:76-2064(-)
MFGFFTEINFFGRAPTALYNVGYTMRFEVCFVLSFLVFWATGAWCRRRELNKFNKKNRYHVPAFSRRHQQGYEAQQTDESSSSLSAPSISSPDKCVQSATSRFNAPRLGHDVIALVKGTVDTSRLQNFGWLVPRFSQLCNSHSHKSFDVYRSALDAGLDLSMVANASGRDKLLSPLLTSAIRTGSVDQAFWVLRDLQRKKLEVSSALYTSMVKLCTSKHLFKECLAIADMLAAQKCALTVEKSVWSCLLFCAVETRADQRCKPFFEQLKASGSPSQKDYWNMIRHASFHADWKMMLQIVEEMREHSIEIDSVIYNTALAACVTASQVDIARKLLEEMDGVSIVADVVTYNTVMKGYAKTGNMEECQAVYLLMCKRGLSPSQVSYGILLDGWLNSNRADEAAKVFDVMTRQGCPMNTVLYTTLIKGFAREGKVDEAMRVYERMSGDGSVQPDLITFSVLLKAHCDDGRLQVGIELLDAMLKLGLKPDEVIYNNLLAGCASQANVGLARELYKNMTSADIRPSNATFSILIRLYSQCKLLDEAFEVLQTESKKHKVDLEARIYSQLIHCCVRARQGRRAVEVYEAMCQKTCPTAAMHASVLGMCVKLNMFDTAVELLQAAAARGAPVDARDAQLVLERARRKNKMSSADACAATMQSMSLHVTH